MSRPRSPLSAIILCDITDSPALWVAAELQALGTRCDVVLAPVLGAARRFEHRKDSNGRGEVVIDLPDGRRLSSEASVPILNRLMAAPLGRQRATGGEDFGYAMQEVFAMHLSWLYAWPATVINRPTPQGLCGNFRHPSAWAMLARNCGLAIEPWRQTSSDGPEMAWLPRGADARAFVVNGKVIAAPELPDSLSDACRLLGEASGTALLGIDFLRGENGAWRFAAASPYPILQAGGDPLVAALAEALS